MIYEALFLPVTEENESGEAVTKRSGEKKEREEWMSMKREPKGEGRREECRGDIYHPVTSLAKNEDRLPSVTEVRWISS